MIKTDQRLVQGFAEIQQIADEMLASFGMRNFSDALSELKNAFTASLPEIAVVTDETDIAATLAIFEGITIRKINSDQAEISAGTVLLKARRYEPAYLNVSPMGTVKPIIVIVDARTLEVSEDLVSVLGCQSGAIHIIYTDQAKIDPELPITNSLQQKASFSFNTEANGFFDQFKGNNLVALAFNYQVLQATEALYQYILLSLEQEERTLKANRILTQQNVSRLQSKQSLSFYDILSQIKGNINLQVSGADKSITDSIENGLRIDSEIYIILQQKTASLDQLQETKKLNQVHLTIPPEFSSEFLQAIRSNLYKKGKENLLFLYDSLRLIESDTLKLFALHKLPDQPVHFKYLTEQPLNEIISYTVRYDKQYQSQTSVKGIYEYFMAIRKYQMLFVMMASTFGAMAVPQVREYALYVSLALLAIGLVGVVRSIKKERIFTAENELEKARETLMAEYKRIASEFTRQWGKTISEHIKNQLNMVVLEIENLLKANQQRKAAEEEEEKKKVQRQLQNIDMLEKKHSNLLRSRESLTRTLTRSKTDMANEIVQIAAGQRK